MAESAQKLKNQVLWYIHTAWDWDRYQDQMESIVPCRNVHTGLRHGQDQNPLFPIVPALFSVLILVLLPCSVNNSLWLLGSIDNQTSQTDSGVFKRQGCACSLKHPRIDLIEQVVFGIKKVSSPIEMIEEILRSIASHPWNGNSYLTGLCTNTQPHSYIFTLY